MSDCKNLVKHSVWAGDEFVTKEGPQKLWDLGDIAVTFAGRLRATQMSLARLLGERDLTQDQERKVRNALVLLDKAHNELRRCKNRD